MKTNDCRLLTITTSHTYSFLLIVLTVLMLMFRMTDCSLSAVVVHEWFRFAGPMERYQAEVELLDRVNSTYLVRHRSKEGTEYAISIK